MKAKKCHVSLINLSKDLLRSLELGGRPTKEDRGFYSNTYGSAQVKRSKQQPRMQTTAPLHGNNVTFSLNAYKTTDIFLPPTTPYEKLVSET